MNKNSFKNKVQTIQYFLENLLVKTRSTMVIFDAVQQEKEQLVNEKHYLMNRASVGYDELTPRPQFHKICEENKLDSKSILDPKIFEPPQTGKKKKVQITNFKKPRVSTNDLIKHLVLQISNKNQILVDMKRQLEFKKPSLTNISSTNSPTSVKRKQTKQINSIKQINNNEKVDQFKIDLKATSINEKLPDDQTDTKILSQKNKVIVHDFKDNQEKLEIDIMKQQFHQKFNKIIDDIEDSQQKLKDMQ